MSKLFNDYTNKDKVIFKKEFKNFLPDNIIDTHVHLFRKEDKIGNTNLNLDKGPSSEPSYEEYTFKDFEYTTEKLFPSKKYSGIFFGIPDKQIDYNKNNQYISEVCKKYNSYGCYLTKNNQNKIPSDFFENRFIGFKPYPQIGKKIEDFSKLDIDVTINEYIPELILDFANYHKLIIINHIPRAGRLNDERNINEIKEITRKYPDIKMILAHSGRSYTYHDIRYNIDVLKKIDNLYFDLSMVQDIRVITELLKKIGRDKLLYASDLPVAGIKGKNVDINNKHYFITKDYRNYSISSSDMDLSEFTFFIYEIIRAIKEACEIINLKEEDIEKIFYRNAKNLIDDIKTLNKIY